MPNIFIFPVDSIIDPLGDKLDRYLSERYSNDIVYRSRDLEKASKQMANSEIIIVMYSAKPHSVDLIDKLLGVSVESEKVILPIVFGESDEEIDFPRYSSLKQRNPIVISAKDDDQFLDQVSKRINDATTIEGQIESVNQLITDWVSDKNTTPLERRDILKQLREKKDRLQSGLQNLSVSREPEFASPTSSISSIGPNLTDREEYLRILHDQLGRVLLPKSQDQASVPLELIYVDLPIDLVINIKVEKFRITNWWISRRAQVRPALPGELRYQIPIEEILGENYDQDGLLQLVQDIEGAINLGIDTHYDDPAKRPLILAPPWYDGLKEEFWPIYSLDIASTVKRLVITGPPGSGKSTFVKYLALCLIGEQIGLKSINISNAKYWFHGALTPIFIELRQFVNWDRFPELDKKLTIDHFWDYVEDEILSSRIPGFVNELRTDLSRGKAVIIFDGLDEIPTPTGKTNYDRRRRQIKDFAQSICTTYANSRVVFTCRDYAYDDWELDGFISVELSTLEPRTIEKIATKLYVQNGFSESIAQVKAKELVLSLSEVPATLKDYPLFLTMMASLFIDERSGLNEGLPSSRGDLYRESIDLLLRRWIEPREQEASFIKQIGCSSKELFERLEIIAYKTHKNASIDDADTEISYSILASELLRMGETVEGINPVRVLSFLSHHSGVIVTHKEVSRDGEPLFQFVHRGFQEYFAASYIAREMEKHYEEEDAYPLLAKLIESDPNLWREPFLLLGDILTQRRKVRLIWYAIYNLIDIGDQMPSLDSPKWWSIWLASRFLSDQDLYENVSFENKLVVEKMRKQLKYCLANRTTLGTHERVDIGFALGSIGDDRPGVGTIAKIPDIVWCDIPGGDLILGVDETQQEEILKQTWGRDAQFRRETPSCPITVRPFKISKYPITYAQFQAFLDDLDEGYNMREWWTQAGWNWKQNAAPVPEPEWGKQANLPRTNISWFEAVAFCNWLSSKINCTVRLPTEAEWELAARGIDGRLFPWGNTFEVDYCNSSLSNFARPVPVGCYVIENHPWGNESPADMSGNIWEWCNTICQITGEDEEIKYPYDPEDGREDVNRGEECFRVVRGGSYLNPPFLLRTTYRGRDKAIYRLSREGFRVVREI